MTGILVNQQMLWYTLKNRRYLEGTEWYNMRLAGWWMVVIGGDHSGKARLWTRL